MGKLEYKWLIWSTTAGVGNFDDGEGHYISIFTPEGHIPYTVGQKPVICHTRVAKIADLQAQNASHSDAFWACRSAIFAALACDRYMECGPL